MFIFFSIYIKNRIFLNLIYSNVWRWLWWFWRVWWNERRGWI